MAATLKVIYTVNYADSKNGTGTRNSDNNSLTREDNNFNNKVIFNISSV